MKRSMLSAPTSAIAVCWGFAQRQLPPGGKLKHPGPFFRVAARWGPPDVLKRCDDFAGPIFGRQMIVNLLIP